MSQPESFSWLQSIDERSVSFQIVQRPYPQVQRMERARRADNVGVAHHMMSAAALGTNADIHAVNFPNYPAMPDAAGASPRHVNELPGFRHASVM